MDMQQQHQDKYYQPFSSDVIQSTVDEILSIAEKKLNDSSLSSHKYARDNFNLRNTVIIQDSLKIDAQL